MSTLKLRKRVPEWKIRRVEYIRRLAEKYPYILVVSIENVSSPVLSEIRAILKAKGDVLKVIKNALAIRALKAAGREGLVKYLKGSNALLFTRTNPFSLKIFIDKNRVRREARVGDIAQNDIVISEGNTGFPPGPLISLFNKLRIPIRIQEGSIWVTKDTIVARKGERITSDLAELLKRLGIKPIEVGLHIKAAYIDGHVISGDELELDLEKYKEEIANAHTQAINLSINSVFPTRETVEAILTKSIIESHYLVLNTVLPIKESLESALRRGVLEAQVLHSQVEKSLG
ncbi:MAG: 50S ribosomal protein L10 [Thermoprotei archaeon]|nr:MAG: 50S ribosomal protein L10 [Thermoprotei archaeon]